MHHACYVRTLLALALIVALALAASACTGEDDGSSVPVRVPTASPTPERTPVAASPTSTPTSSPAPTPVAASPTGPIEASLTVGFAEVFGGREFDRPVEIGAYPAGPQPGQTMFVAEQGGRVLLLRAGSDEAGLLLDLRNEVLTRGNEQGLLSVALDPRFEENGYLWLYYSAAGTPAVSRLSRFAVDPDDPLRVDPDSELVILDVEQPYSNHNGGAIRFGPDGMLYLGYGDGGSAGDPKRNGQNLGTLLGSVIRIDVRFASEAGPYSIPAGNPFIHAEGARPEIWAYGLRNPWRMAFDPATGVLWAGDVGQNELEEIDRIERGANYGWNRLEGSRCFEPREGCDRADTLPPVAEYGHGLGCSVTGGVVYRGEAITALVGHYLFADFCSGRLWALPPGGGAVVELPTIPRPVSSFGTDASGEVYVLTFGGAVLRIVPH